MTAKSWLIGIREMEALFVILSEAKNLLLLPNFSPDVLVIFIEFKKEMLRTCIPRMVEKENRGNQWIPYKSIDIYNRQRMSYFYWIFYPKYVQHMQYYFRNGLYFKRKPYRFKSGRELDINDSSLCLLSLFRQKLYMHILCSK